MSKQQVRALEIQNNAAAYALEQQKKQDANRDKDKNLEFMREFTSRLDPGQAAIMGLKFDPSSPTGYGTFANKEEQNAAIESFARLKHRPASTPATRGVDLSREMQRKRADIQFMVNNMYPQEEIDKAMAEYDALRDQHSEQMGLSGKSDTTQVKPQQIKLTNDESSMASGIAEELKKTWNNPQAMGVSINAFDNADAMSKVIVANRAKIHQMMVEGAKAYSKQAGEDRPAPKTEQDSIREFINVVKNPNDPAHDVWMRWLRAKTGSGQ